ncbi:MAG: hypothetical protein RLY31_2133 [Bacteroidota bacterium]
MKRFRLVDYFYYTSRERNAGLSLVFLSLLLLVLPALVGPFLERRPSVDVQAVQALVRSWDSLSVATRAPAPSRPAAPAAPFRQERFPFDPNTADEAQLQRLGLRVSTARTLLRYREKGGVFRRPEDLRRVYGIDERLFAELLPFIRLDTSTRTPPALPGRAAPPAAADSKPAAPSYVKKDSTALVDINRATAEDWQRLPGIGPGYARRIVRFRDRLGGFSHPAQVGETYGLPDSVFRRIMPRLVPSPVFRPLPVNTPDLAELKAHPYLSNLQATVLFRYREQHGPFRSPADLQAVGPVFSEQDWARLAPYLTFEPSVPNRIPDSLTTLPQQP